MCGIFGYVGARTDAAKQTLAGLKLLEYRGYDSWGIAVSKNKKIIVDKHIGKIGDAKTLLPESNIAIGHTRWATHGGVTVANAHPHLDCSQTIAVLHNGIIENFQDLKAELLLKGHKFISETDTEVMSHLIEEYSRKENFELSVKRAFGHLKGLSAFVIINAASQEIIAVKTGSPLILGISKDGYYVASDVSGIVQHTRKIIFLEDNQMAVLNNTLRIYQLPKGKMLKPKIHNVDWKFDTVNMGKYKHFLLKEIHEQPQVISNISVNFDTQIKKLSQAIEKAHGTFFLGCGTAGYAGLAGTYLFSSIAKKHVNFVAGSEFKYLEDFIQPTSLIVPISQSGETIDVVEPVARAKEKGAKIAAIVNVLGSTLYRQANEKVLLQAGPERAVVGTKSFIAMISVLLLTAYTLAKKQKEGKDLLKKSAENIEEILKKPSIRKIQNLAQKLKNAEHIYILGRGLSYATSLESTLKIKETCYIHAEGFAGGELKHGVIALIEKGTPCIILAPHDETYDEIISNAQEVKARGAFIVGIGPKENNVFDVFIKTADVGKATILSQVVVSQLLAYYLALAKGIKDPDKPRNLAKSVTVK